MFVNQILMMRPSCGSDRIARLKRNYVKMMACPTIALHLDIIIIGLDAFDPAVNGVLILAGSATIG